MSPKGIYRWRENIKSKSSFEIIFKVAKALELFFSFFTPVISQDSYVSTYFSTLTSRE